MSADPKQRADIDRWHDLASKELRGKNSDELVWDTPDVLVVKALYTAADLENLDYADTLPGQWPRSALEARNSLAQRFWFKKDTFVERVIGAKNLG